MLMCAMVACRAPCTHVPWTVMLDRLQQGVLSLAALLPTCQMAMLWRRPGSLARPRSSMCSKSTPVTCPEVCACACRAALSSSCSLCTELCACVPSPHGEIEQDHLVASQGVSSVPFLGPCPHPSPPQHPPPPCHENEQTTRFPASTADLVVVLAQQQHACCIAAGFSRASCRRSALLWT